jgi:hypothetical protein
MMDWIDFAKDQIEGYHGATLTDHQIGILEDKFNDGDVWNGIENKMGIRLESPFRSKGQIVLRDLHTGKFTSRVKANNLLAGLRATRDMVVKTGKYVRDRFRRSK